MTAEDIAMGVLKVLFVHDLGFVFLYAFIEILDFLFGKFKNRKNKIQKGLEKNDK